MLGSASVLKGAVNDCSTNIKPFRAPQKSSEFSSAQNDFAKSVPFSCNFTEWLHAFVVLQSNLTVHSA